MREHWLAAGRALTVAATNLGLHHPHGSRKGGPGDVSLRDRSAIARPHLQGGSAGSLLEGGQGTRGPGAVFRVAARVVEPGMTTRAEGRDRQVNGVEPYAWLKSTLEKTAGGHPQERIRELLPWDFDPAPH